MKDKLSFWNKLWLVVEGVNTKEFAIIAIPVLLILISCEALIS